MVPISTRACVIEMKTVSWKNLVATFSMLASAAIADETMPGDIQFDRDVRPILTDNCLRCHGPEKSKSGFRLDDRTAALNGGNDNTDDIVPGHSRWSKLIAYVAGTSPDFQMPPPDRGTPLTPEQVDILRAWIDEGAPWGTNPPPVITMEIEPVVDDTIIQGDRRKARELDNIPEGPGGGLGHFSVTEQVAPGKTLSLDGHALLPQDDLKVQLALTKSDEGFLHTGLERWRKYYDDTGGFYPAFSPSTFSLDRDLHLDIGRAWLEFGLTYPDKPQLVVGYEYQFRQGTKSALAWGPVVQGANVKNTYPDPETVNEHVHIFKADISREGDDWSVENHARVEVYRLVDSRDDAAVFTTGPGPDVIQRVNQKIRYTLGSDTFRVEKQITDWWLASGGVLLSRYDGTSLLNQTAVDGAGTPAFGFFDWRTEGITLERDSKVASLASSFLPVDGLSLSAAVQGEQTDERGLGNVDLDLGVPSLPGFTANPGTVNANQDRRELSENFEAHYSRLSHTVLFAEGRLRQQEVGQFDEAVNPTTDAVRQRTDAANRFYDARVGFTESPWTSVEWGGHARRRESISDYDHLVDQTPNSPVNGDGYPAFIRHRDIAMDEVEARLTIRPARWLNARLTYDWNLTEFSSVTDPVSGGLSPGGYIYDGRTTAHNAALMVMITPARCYYFSGTVTYGYSRTVTTSDAAPQVVPYRGDLYTLGSAIGYILDEKTDLDANYHFSHAGYGQNNTAGIPLGMDFTRHELSAGVKRQLTKNLAGGLRYQFSRYEEPSSRNANNFTAHGVFATLAYRWR